MNEEINRNLSCPNIGSNKTGPTRVKSLRREIKLILILNPPVVEIFENVWR
jgi:hypothetical protein